MSQDGVSAEPVLQTNAVASIESAGLRFCFRVETDEVFLILGEKSCFNLDSHALGFNLINASGESWASTG